MGSYLWYPSSGHQDEPLIDASPDRRLATDEQPIHNGDAGARILLIDGNLLTAETFVLAAAPEGYRAQFLSPVTATRLRAQLAVSVPAVAVLDIDSVAAATSIDFIGIIRGRVVPVIAMGGRLEVLAECVNAGAAFAMDKKVLRAEFFRVVGKVLAGQLPTASSRTAHFARTLQENVRERQARLAPFDILTHREKCVLAGLMEGHNAEAIAAQSSVSISTVRSQIKAILQKLGVNSQLAATVFALQAGWSFGRDRRDRAG